jgi:hypothetical protein
MNGKEMWDGISDRRSDNYDKKINRYRKCIFQKVRKEQNITWEPLDREDEKREKVKVGTLIL